MGCLLILKPNTEKTYSRSLAVLGRGRSLSVSTELARGITEREEKVWLGNAYSRPPRL